MKLKRKTNFTGYLPINIKKECLLPIRKGEKS